MRRGWVAALTGAVASTGCTSVLGDFTLGGGGDGGDAAANDGAAQDSAVDGEMADTSGQDGVATDSSPAGDSFAGDSGADGFTGPDGDARADAKGDGHSEADAPTGDADGGNPKTVQRAFVSSAKYFGDSIGGVASADSNCQGLATAAGLGKGWKAWFSSLTSNAKDRLVLGNNPVILIDGTTVVVAKGTDLTSGTLLHAIDQTEHGAVVSPTLVWTGTATNGNVYTGSRNAGLCGGNWTVASTTGAAGGSNQVGATWTQDGLQSCTTNYPIYCFGP